MADIIDGVVESTPEPTSTTTPFIPGYVKIINLTPSERTILLRQSIKEFHLAPFSRKWTAHISEPFPKKYLTDAIKAMKSRGEIDIMEVTE
jgi:hypothetical protein